MWLVHFFMFFCIVWIFLQWKCVRFIIMRRKFIGPCLKEHGASLRRYLDALQFQSPLTLGSSSPRARFEAISWREATFFSLSRSTVNKNAWACRCSGESLAAITGVQRSQNMFARLSVTRYMCICTVWSVSNHWQHFSLLFNFHYFLIIKLNSIWVL